MKKQLPDHIQGLIDYLLAPDEKANEDLILKYFRNEYGSEFKRQKEAKKSDGYVPGHFVLELKGKSDDWISGFFQGLAYKRNLDFSVVVVAAHRFLAIWALEDLDEAWIEAALKEKGAPSTVGKKLAQKYRSSKKEILKFVSYQFPAEYLDGLFKADSKIIEKEVDAFTRVLRGRKRVRHKITTKNFSAILKQMTEFFDPSNPIKAVRAFYSMVFSWKPDSIVEISSKYSDQATLGGETVESLVPGKREKFKSFVERHFVHLEENENEDDFFAMYDKALDAVDPEFRIKNGIFFTDLDLCKFTMWYARRELGDIGKNHLVIDPACGSGNLVTNWRSPMELRHKVVSEIEPELLYTVEQRMRGDKWHNGKFTVVPKIQENRGLNFLDKSAEEYIEIIKQYLKEKGHKPDKPIAFLCNPPYRSDDDQAAESIKYQVHPSILELTGQDGSAERYACFLAQMRLICERAEQSGLPEESLLLLFTKAAWLTKRPVFQEIRRSIFGVFEDVGGLIINSKEFFDVKGRFPIAFTMWRYRGVRANLDQNRSIAIRDLTWLKTEDLASIDWNNKAAMELECEKLLNSSKTKQINFGTDIPNIKQWSGLTRFDFQREKRAAERVDPDFKCGLPKGDPRHKRKKTLGENNGEFIGFMDDLTPCRIKKDAAGAPWFRLNNQFMDCRKTRCFSGPPDKLAYSASDRATAEKVFTWYALGRVFASHGYPMWVDADEMWPIAPPKGHEKKLIKLVFSIGFAENECVSAVFPAGNPVREAKEIEISNPMNPLSPSSFWNREMASEFGMNPNDPEEKLVSSVLHVFKLWSQKFTKKAEIYVDYKRPYFVGDGLLTKDAGLVQIRDYAKEMDDKVLNVALEEVAANLKATKDLFFELLHSKTGFNYFEATSKFKYELDRKATLAKQPDEPKGFDRIIDMRLGLASKIVKEMYRSKEFNRVKFAKVFYLSDAVTSADLKTEYYREPAGPLDQRTLYNEKIGIESLAKKRCFFSAQKKKGTEFDFVVYSLESKIDDGMDLFSSHYKSGDVEKIDKVIELTKSMTRDQVEIVATLYACWNDLLAQKKKPSDKEIVCDFMEQWHVEKSAKFKKDKKGKIRFTEQQLFKALQWMREKGLIPNGRFKTTRRKVTRDDIPF